MIEETSQETRVFGCIKDSQARKGMDSPSSLNTSQTWVRFLSRFFSLHSTKSTWIPHVISLSSGKKRSSSIMRSMMICHAKHRQSSSSRMIISKENDHKRRLHSGQETSKVTRHSNSLKQNKWIQKQSNHMNQNVCRNRFWTTANEESSLTTDCEILSDTEIVTFGTKARLHLNSRFHFLLFWESNFKEEHLHLK